MNPTHLHLILNHLPVVGIGFVALLLIVALIKRNNDLKRLSLFFLVLITLLAIPVYLTGEPAEETVEKIPGVVESMIEEHEDAAQSAFTGQIILGVLALTALIVFRKGRALPNWAAGTVLACTLAVAGLMAWTANLGGGIRHPEISAKSVATTGRDRD